MRCPGPFHFSHIADYIDDFCPLSDPDVGLSILVHFGLCGSKFVLCLFGPGLCTMSKLVAQSVAILPVWHASPMPGR